MPAPLFLLDTGVLMALINGKDLGERIDKAYGLRASANRPLVCIVTHGELWAMAGVHAFGVKKRDAIRHMLHNVVTVDISDEHVIQAYTEVYAALRSHPQGSRTNIGENDMWIAAATRASGASLITLDSHFDALHPHTLQRHFIAQTTSS